MAIPKSRKIEKEAFGRPSHPLVLKHYNSQTQPSEAIYHLLCHIPSHHVASKLCMRRFRVTALQQINIRDLGLPYNWGWVLVRWTKHIACEWFFLSLIALSYFSFHRGFLAPIVFHWWSEACPAMRWDEMHWDERYKHVRISDSRPMGFFLRRAWLPSRHSVKLCFYSQSKGFNFLMPKKRSLFFEDLVLRIWYIIWVNCPWYIFYILISKLYLSWGRRTLLKVEM